MFRRAEADPVPAQFGRGFLTKPASSWPWSITKGRGPGPAGDPDRIDERYTAIQQFRTDVGLLAKVLGTICAALPGAVMSRF